MDKYIFGKKQLNSQPPRLDRFVAPRLSLDDTRKRFSWREGCTNDIVDIWDSKYMHQRKYRNYIDEAFGLEPLWQKSQPFVKSEDNDWVQPWPCIPRKRRYLSSADSILDLPTYSRTEFPELLDWGNDNILVAALGRYYYKWSWNTQQLESKGFALYNIQCCKFDPRGELLILGTDMMLIEMHNNLLNKWIGSNKCKCYRYNNTFPCCSITALDWSVTGNSFMAGCSRGYVSSFARRNISHLSTQRVSDEPVLSVRVSPDTRFASAIVLNSPKVFLFTWPWLQPLSVVISESVVKTITWHPWRSALLGIGLVTDSKPKLALYDAAPEKLRLMSLGHSPYMLDAMLFSHISGELVLSLWNPGGETTHPHTHSQLVVLSNPLVVVDQWGEGRGANSIDRVRTMVFSPDGTKLATATTGEDLIIWNFLPDDNKRKIKQSKRTYFSVIPEFLDKAVDGTSLR